ncbi:MAG: ligase-associated DNA damage response endonuclease PdeM [Rhodobacteraceae bacterium]|nr:MAG: ligase-associated DNA damage response endonuclease PdeM [Paracoccaceae bacterium]
MTCCAVDFSGHHFRARPSGALYWPATESLIVADLHLGKSERMARRSGALLPPYEINETLTRLETELVATGARRLIALGDSFDDEAAADAALPHLRELAAFCEMLWVSGNHDPGPCGLPMQGEARESGLALRHIAEEGPDISGHYHPKLNFMGQRIPVFLLGPDHLILPAFGTYTGGLDCTDPALRMLVPAGHVILTGRTARMLPFPLPARRTLRAPRGTPPRRGFLLD